jgi:hypothetical protein
LIHPSGRSTEIVNVSRLACQELAGYDPAADMEPCKYYLANKWQGDRSY